MITVRTIYVEVPQFYLRCLDIAVAMVLFGSIVFFFQAEDGIRDLTVTGVQTCALPISIFASRPRDEWLARLHEQDVPCAPVNSVAEALADAQVAHLKLARRMSRPDGASEDRKSVV